MSAARNVLAWKNANQLYRITTGGSISSFFPLLEYKCDADQQTTAAADARDTETGKLPPSHTRPFLPMKQATKSPMNQPERMKSDL